MFHEQVAPLDSTRENLMDVEGQLQLVLHLMKGAKFSYMLPLLNGSVSSWIWSELGITVSRKLVHPYSCSLSGESCKVNEKIIEQDTMPVLHIFELCSLLVQEIDNYLQKNSCLEKNN